MRANVTDKEQVSSMVDAVEQKFGSLDIIVLNATGTAAEAHEQYDADFTVKCTNFLCSACFSGGCTTWNETAGLGKNN